jgi:glucose dehydrogenase
MGVEAIVGTFKGRLQAVHHGIWDYDFGSAPVLVDIVVDGQPIKAVAQVSKQSFVYVFDRVTGQPVWPIVERAVPKGDTPGECQGRHDRLAPGRRCRDVAFRRCADTARSHRAVDLRLRAMVYFLSLVARS